MQVRTFRARSLEEALGQVQQELGPDAHVLQARELETSWWERFSRGRHYEIRTRDQSANPLPLRKSGSFEGETLDEYRSTGERHATEVAGSSTLASPGTPAGTAYFDRQNAGPFETDRPGYGGGRTVDAMPDRLELETDLDARRRRFQDFARPDGSGREGAAATDPFELGGGLEQDGPARAVLPAGSFRRPQATYSSRVLEVISRLIEADITPHAARDLVDAVHEAGAVTAGWTLVDWQHALVGHLHAELPRGGELRVGRGRRKVVALVGPTGTGKTTTVAKLAARWRLEEHLKVALVSADTYRVAAVEQMRTYADIMGLPLEVATTPREMQAALARFADQDVVLVDTAGRSPHDNLQLQELRSLLAETQAEDVLLVLNGPASASHHRLAVHRFREVGATGMVVTKLDEATSLGSLLPVVRETRLPVHYLTCGQSVPEDLAAADPARLIPALLGFEPVDHVA